MKNLTKKSLTSLLIVGVALVALMSCRKNTKAQFVLNKYEYSAGEMLDVTNIKPTKRQIWTITDVEDSAVYKSSEEQPQLVLRLMQEDGIYSVNLFDNEAELKKDVKKSKSFLIKTIRTSLSISSISSSTTDHFSLYVDNESIAITTSGQIIRNLPIGKRLITIRNELNQTIHSEMIHLKEGESEHIYL